MAEQRAYGWDADQGPDTFDAPAQPGAGSMFPDRFDDEPWARDARNWLDDGARRFQAQVRRDLRRRLAEAGAWQRGMLQTEAARWPPPPASAFDPGPWAAVRDAFAEPGAVFDWDAQRQQVTVNASTRFRVGQREALYHGRPITLAEAPRLIDGHVLVPYEREGGLRLAGGSSLAGRQTLAAQSAAAPARSGHPSEITRRRLSPKVRAVTPVAAPRLTSPLQSKAARLLDALDGRTPSDDGRFDFGVVAGRLGRDLVDLRLGELKAIATGLLEPPLLSLAALVPHYRKYGWQAGNQVLFSGFVDSLAFWRPGTPIEQGERLGNLELLLAGPVLGKSLRLPARLTGLDTSQGFAEAVAEVHLEGKLARTRWGQNRQAGRLWRTRLEASEQLAQDFEGVVPGGQASMTGPRGGLRRASPKGWTWHHVSTLIDPVTGKPAPGYMWLVRTESHGFGGRYYVLLHPAMRGGFAEWGAMAEIAAGTPRGMLVDVSVWERGLAMRSAARDTAAFRAITVGGLLLNDAEGAVDGYEDEWYRPHPDSVYPAGGVWSGPDDEPAPESPALHMGYRF